MMRFDPTQWVWELKYRPQTLNDCILPESLLADFRKMVEVGELKNMLLVSPNPGTGKTTIALALCNELDADVLFINASEDSGIDVFRNDIRKFASTVSMTGSRKVVVLDEADNLSDAAQKAFRGMIEEFSDNCRFILTCNYQNRIIEPIRSRLKIYEFVITPEDKPAMMKGQLVRLIEILKREGVKVESNKVVWELVNRKFPDNRSMLVDLQSYAMKGVIDEGILGVLTGGTDIANLAAYIKAKNFKEIRAIIPRFAANYPVFIRELYDTLLPAVKSSHVPSMIEMIGSNQESFTRVPDVEIHITWLCVSLMMNLEWN